MATFSVPPALLAFYADHQTPTPVDVTPYEWPEVVDLLTTHQFTPCNPCPGGQACEEKKRNGAFSPGAPRAGTGRLNVNVDSVSLLVYDFDHKTRDRLAELVANLAGLECVLYSTHSHQRKNADDCCVRIVFPLQRALTPAEFVVVWREVQRAFGFDGETDSAAKDPSRVYFLPTAPEGSEVEAGHQEGALLDLDALLKRAAPVAQVRAVASGVPLPPVAPAAPAATDMDLLRTLLKAYRPKNSERDEGEKLSRKELVRRVHDADPLVREDEDGQREKSCHRLGKILAYLLPIETPEDAVVELVRKSVSLMPVRPDDGPDDTLDARFAKLAYSWRRGIAERLEQQAVFETERKAEKESTRKLVQRFNLGRKRKSEAAVKETAPDEHGNDVAVEPHGADLSERFDEAAWEDHLQFKETKQGPVLRDFLANIVLILSFHPEWRETLRYNELTKNIEVSGGPLGGYHQPSEVLVATKFWLQREYSLDFNTNDVLDALGYVAKQNAYNPVQDHLNSVGPWDGVSRADTFLETYCGVTLRSPDDDTDITDHVRRLSRRWLISAVARGLEPGCKVDTVLIFEGKTGIYKSSALKVLGGPFFSDSKITIGSNDAMMLAGRNWIHELSELVAFKASETEQQKAFFSSPVDTFRAPYGRVVEEFKRLCVFVGSTNDEHYLNDLTGNRRYWPVECVRQFDLAKMMRDRDQIWAEAVAIYRAADTCAACKASALVLDKRCVSHRWWLNADENEKLEEVNRHRLKGDYAEAIVGYLLRLPKSRRQKSYTMFEVGTNILGLYAERMAAQQQAIGRSLKLLGFTKRREAVAGLRQVVHDTPDRFYDAPDPVGMTASANGAVHKLSSPLQSVKGGKA